MKQNTFILSSKRAAKRIAFDEKKSHPDFDRNLEHCKKFIQNSRPSWPAGVRLSMSEEEHLIYVAAIFPDTIFGANFCSAIPLHQPNQSFSDKLHGAYESYRKKILELQRMYPKELFQDFSKNE
jgi:hypothetical protein